MVIAQFQWPIIIADSQTSIDWPTDRNSMQIAYDSGSDRTILFGGWGETFESYGDTLAYNLNDNSWENMSPTVAPGKRAGNAIAYDTQSDRTILFSGHKTGASTTLENWNDTWAYDYDSNTWTNLEPSQMPSPRLSAPMVYDSQSKVMILFGGLCDGGIFNNETWVFDYSTNNWTNMEPLVAPSHRVAGMAYDIDSDLVILFGGGGYGPEGWPIKIYTDTWTYNYETNTWTKMNPADSPSSLGLMAYDEESDLCVFHGGCMDWFEEDIVSETWTYNYNANTWTEKSTSPVPEPRSRIAIAYDSESDRTVLYSGGKLNTIGSVFEDYTYLILNDLWTFDANTGVWERLYPPPFNPWIIIVIGGGVIIIAIVILYFLQRRRGV
jgi:N-acetylneuraminic acid mutarotase